LGTIEGKFHKGLVIGKNTNFCISQVMAHYEVVIIKQHYILGVCKVKNILGVKHDFFIPQL
jgi:hypothetical protein